jgi:hypothetical protein
MPLKTKVVGIYTVSQFGTLESVRARLFHEQVEPLKKSGKNLTDDEQAMNEWLDEWVTFAACTSPLMTRDDYAALPMETYAQLASAMDELNSDLSGVSVPGSKKKNAKHQTNSTSASEK